MAICKGSVCPSSSTMTGAPMLKNTETQDYFNTFRIFSKGKRRNQGAHDPSLGIGVVLPENQVYTW